MNKIFFLMVVIVSPAWVMAQKSTAAVKGIVLDTATGKGLAYSTVSIVNAKDSTLISFTRADSTGKFRLGSLEKGNYLLSASYVGFVPVWKKIALTSGNEMDLGILPMTDLLTAGNVTVTGRRAPVTINNDTLEFNTENFKTQPNAVAEDLLKKLPGVTVDNDGTVRVNGQRINRVLVNGKEFFTGDPKMATRNLDADAIDKVQVFDKKSDRSEFTGVDDGQSEKAINLKLKKDRNRATFGKVALGAGDKQRFDGQTNVNRFNGEQQLSFIGMGNNTNRQGFSITDILNFTGELSRGMRGGSGITIRTGGGPSDNGLPVTGQGQNQQGIAKTFAGGINYNDKWNKKTDVNMSGMASDIDLNTQQSTTRQNLLPGNSFNYFSNNSNNRHNRQQSTNLAIDHQFDSTASVKFTPQFGLQQTDIHAVSDYLSQDSKGIKLNQGITDSKSHAEAFNFNGNALFRKRMAKKGRTLSGTISLAYNDSKQKGELNTRNTFFVLGAPLPDSITNQKNSRDAITRSLGANLVYTEPIGKKSLLELSLYYNTSLGKSKRETFDYSTLTGKFDRLNTALTNDFTSEYTYAGGSFNFRANGKKLNLSAGSSLQSATLVSNNNTNNNRIKQTFTDALPNASVQYKINTSRNLSLNYTTATAQPTTTQLQPIADISDPLFTRTGNPDLKRSYTHTVNLNYFATNMYTRRNFFAFASATLTNNAIVNAEIIHPNGARISMPVNANGNFLLFGSVNAGFPLKKLKSRVDIGLGTNMLHNISIVNGSRNEIDNRSISPNLTYSFTLEDKLDIQATARINISQAKYSLQPQLNSNYIQQVYGWEMTNYLPWGLVINNNLTYTINSGRADGYNTNIGFWNASLAKSFLKNKRAELKLSAFDLLNQNVGINRNANQNFIEDTRYNVLQQYYLATFTLRLNKAGTSANGPNVVIRSF